jgi:hypothetical protein
VFRRAGARNVTWLWTVSHSNTSFIARYWPGSKYVGWVGLDGYFARPQASFHTVFGPALHTVRQLTDDPVLLSEVGVGQVSNPAADITSLFTGVRQFHLLGLVYYDVDQQQLSTHQNWRLEGRPAELQAFRRGARQLLAGR